MPTIRTATEAETAAAILAGYHGVVDFDYQLWQSDIFGSELALIETVETATVTLSNDRDNTWELGVNLNATSDIDPFLDIVKLVIRIRSSLDDWISYPFGLYRFASPKGTDNVFYTSWDLIGESLEVLLLDNQASTGYKINAGVGALSAARAILASQGIPTARINFPSTDNAISKNIVISPQQNSADAYYLRIVNKVLAAGGFYALYTDAEGFFTTKELGGQQPPAVRYTANGDNEGEELISGDIEWEYTREFFNKVTVFESDGSTDAPPVWHTAELHNKRVSAPNVHTTVVVDADSPFAIEEVGVHAAEPKSYQHIKSDVEAQLLAIALLNRIASRHQVIQFPTMPDPRRGPREKYRVIARRSDGSILHNMTVRVTGFELPLDLSEMSHEVSRNVEEL